MNTKLDELRKLRKESDLLCNSLTKLNDKLTERDYNLKPIDMNKTQKEQILELLQEGYHLTKLQILNKIGCWNSGEAIRRLRDEGYNIKTTMETHKVTNKSYAVYSLIK